MASILVADDSADLLEAFEYVLRINKFEVYKADSRESFFDQLQETNPDIVLIDVKFCASDGRLLCHKIKKGPWERIPVILMSASPELLIDYELFGASAVIEKPFSAKEVLNIISLYLKQPHHIYQTPI